MSQFNYKWDKKYIFKSYLKCLKMILKGKKNEDFCNLMLDKEYYEDMLFFVLFKFPSFRIFNNIKKDLKLDKKFIKNNTTIFQRQNIKKYIKEVLDSPFLVTELAFDYNEDELISDCNAFLNNFPKLKNELTDAINNNRLYIEDSKRERNYSGSTYSINDENFYEIYTNSINNPFITTIHELIHGYINTKTKRKFDKTDNIVLYREVGNILMELYANDYLLNNNLITNEEYTSNFNSVFLNSAYNDIEIIDVLYGLAVKDDFIINKRNVKRYIDDEYTKDPNYDITLNELTEFPLKHHLIYLYSTMIALSIYNNHKTDIKTGMDIALDIMINVNEKNEEILFNKYNINPIDAMNSYIETNNKLIKKRNN